MGKNIEQILTGLADELGMELLNLNEHSVCRIVIDQRYVVDLEWVEKQQTLVVYSVIHSHAEEIRDRYPDLLSANLFGHKTNGGVIGVDHRMNQVLLHRSLPIDSLSVQTLLAELERFVEATIQWSRALAHQSETSTDSGSSPPSDFIRV